MIQCESCYFGMVKVWRCALQAGHGGPHHDNIERPYCSWNDEDSLESLVHYIERGGNK